MRIDYQYLNTCFNGLKVLVVGDVILDHYLIGKVDRISPEAPVPVVLHETEDYRLGGAANVALNIKSMGAVPILVSVLGEDKNALQLQNLLVENNISPAYLVKDNQRVTTCKTRVLARNQHLLRYDHESTHDIDKNIENQLITMIEKLMTESKIHVMVFQDYNKGVLTEKLIQNLLEIADKYAVITLADPKKNNFLSYKGVTWFKPNLREINEALHLQISEKQPSVEQLLVATQKIKSHLNNSSVLITLGAKGMFFCKDQLSALIPTKERHIADVCGAGDTVISIFALGIAVGLNIEDLVVLANIAGGQVCEQVGVVPVNKENLLKEYMGK